MDPMGVDMYLQQKSIHQVVVCDWMPQLSVLLICSFLTARTGLQIDFTTTTMVMLWHKLWRLRYIREMTNNGTKELN